MEIIDKVYSIRKKINEEGLLKPDLTSSNKGKNYRAVSEAQLLEVINPLLEEEGLVYTLGISDRQLDIREVPSGKGKKLQFIAHLTLGICLWGEKGEKLFHESVGMGIDDGDRAMGKAYTYALKYGLLKLFGLQYSDDPDAFNCEPIPTKEVKPSGEKAAKAKEEKKEENKPKKKVTAKMIDLILALRNQKNVTEEQIVQEFGYNSYDAEMPLEIGQKIIEWLKNNEFLPF